MPTPDEVEALKQNWREDPCWNIEDTEGFEAHRAELLEWRLEREAAWTAAEQARKEQRAAELGIPGNLAFLEHIERLEWRIKQLEG